MPVFPLPLVGQPNQRGFSITDITAQDQLYRGVIFQAVPNPLTKSADVYVQKRLGLYRAKAPEPSASVASACFNSPSFAGSFFSAFTSASSGTASQIYQVTTGLGAVSADHVVFHINETVLSSGTTNFLFTAQNVASSSQGWYSAGGGAGSLTQITDAQFPSDVVGQPQEMGGYVFWMTRSGRVYNSDLDSVTSYTAAAYFPCDSITDDGVGLARLGDQLFSFGNNSIEILVNAGNPAPGSPLKRIKTISIGASSSGIGFGRALITASRDRLAWLDSGFLNLYVYSGGTIDKIPTSGVFGTISTSAGIRSISFITIFAQDFIHISRQVSGSYLTMNLFYSLDTGMWCDPNFATGCMIFDEACYNDRATGIVGVSSTNTNGDVYAIDPTNATWQDDDPGGGGTNFSVVLQTSRFDLGTNKRKFIKSLALVADRQTSGTVQLEYTDDDYGSWVVHPDTFDLTNLSKKVFRLGSHKNGRAYRLTYTGNTGFRAQRPDIEYEIGAS